MFSKKIRLFVCSFISILLVTNLFALPVFGEDLPYTDSGVKVSDGELIYLVAQANGVKFSGEPNSVFKYLKQAYRYYGQFVTSLVSDLVGFVTNGINGYLNVSQDVYNSIVLFLRDYLLPHGYIDKSGITVLPLTGHERYYFHVSTGTELGYLSPVNKIVYSHQGSGTSNSTYKCKEPGSCRFYSTSTVYVFKGSYSDYLVSLKPNTKIKFSSFNYKTGQEDNIEFNIGDRSYTNNGITIYSNSVTLYDIPIYYDGVLSTGPSIDLATITYLLSNNTSNPTISFSSDFNINNIRSSSSNVTITNIYYNDVTNNITINNNGTQEPIDDNVQSDVVAPTVPNIKPYDVVIDLNNIDNINNYHNIIDTNTNDFLIQFNENLNKIDTKCYSLSSCAVNGLKSVGNAVNDITGYSEKGMNSDFVLLICLFLLLGILFTIL